MRKLAAALAIMMVALVFGFAVTQSMIVEAQSGVMVGLNWNGTYYSDVNFTTPAFTRVETNGINFSYGLGSPGTGVPVDNFSIRWTGVQNFPVTGVYRFTVFRDEDAEEHGVYPAFLRPRQVELPVGGAVSHVPAVVKLPVCHVHVSVEHERVLVKLSCPVGHRGQLLCVLLHGQDRPRHLEQRRGGFLDARQQRLRELAQRLLTGGQLGGGPTELFDGRCDILGRRAHLFADRRPLVSRGHQPPDGIFDGFDVARRTPQRLRRRFSLGAQGVV